MARLRDMPARIIGAVQGSLFPAVEEHLCNELTEQEKKLVEVLVWAEIEKPLPDRNVGLPGQPPRDRVNIAKAFAAKAVCKWTKLSG